MPLAFKENESARFPPGRILNVFSVYSNKFRKSGIVQGHLCVMLGQAEKRLAAAIKNAGILDLSGQKAGISNDKKTRALIGLAKKKAGMRDDNDDTRIVKNLHFRRALTDLAKKKAGMRGDNDKDDGGGTVCVNEMKFKQIVRVRGGSDIVAARNEKCKKRKSTRKHKIIRGNKTVSTACAVKVTQFEKPPQEFDFMSAYSN